MIDFNRPHLTGKEMEYALQAYENAHISGDGNFTKKCNAILEEVIQAPKALLTTSCTHALELSALLLNIQPGDEVIIPSFTFVSTINAFVLRGARPIFVDIRPDTLNLDESLIESRISEHTKAIIPVHYAGVGCEMDVIQKISNRHHIPIVEDNAHGLFGKYHGKPLGSFGCMATQSFHETKNISMGEGGALIINDPELIERAEILREKGTNRSRFFRGMVDKYTWVDIGSSYLPSDILAAVLYAQLEKWQSIQQHRADVWNYYHDNLTDWAAKNDCRLPVIPEHCQQAYHMFYLLLPNLDTRQRLIKHLKQQQVHAVFHYLPLHLSDMGQKFGGKPGDCPVTESVSDRLVRLPFHNALTQEEQSWVVKAINSFRF
ncbi:MAG: dTDP-4-amino-4,6-dideoxygalactose transaminase [Anaerolineaceae bacterium]